MSKLFVVTVKVMMVLSSSIHGDGDLMDVYEHLNSSRTKKYEMRQRLSDVKV
jgi:hypothetical protein